MLTALKQVYQWFNLGLHLKVPYHTLKKIKREQRERVEDSKQEMLVVWLQGQGGEPSKQFLIASLRNMKCKIVEHIEPVSIPVRPVTGAKVRRPPQTCSYCLSYGIIISATSSPGNNWRL